MAQVIEHVVEHHRMSQIDADGAEDVLRVFVSFVDQFLDGLELFARGQARVKRNADGGRELDDGIL